MYVYIIIITIGTATTIVNHSSCYIYIYIHIHLSDWKGAVLVLISQSINQSIMYEDTLIH